MSESTMEQDRIEEDLQRTRSRMDRRLNELQGKLAPGQIFEDLLDYVRGNGGAEFGQKLMASVQKNPLPAVVAGVGIAWLMASDFRPQPTVATVPASSGGVAGYEPDTSASYDFEQRMRDAEACVTRGGDDTDQSYADRLEDARAKVVGVARQAQDTAASFGQRVQAAMASARDSATRGSHNLRDRSSGMASQVSGSAQQIGGQLRDSAQQMGGQLAQGARSAQQSGSDMLASLTANPMALGAMGLAAGALIGLLLPHSEQEEAAFGGAAGQVRDAARGVAQSVVDQGGGLARQVMDTARESAAAHGFTTDKSLDDVVGDIKSGNIIDNAKQVAQEVLNAGEQALHKGDTATAPPAAPPA